MKNIMHVVTNVLDGGLEKVVYLICSNLDKRQYSQTLIILTTHESSFLLNEFHSLGFEIVMMKFDNKLFSPSSFFNNIIQIFKLARIIKRKKIQILHTHDFFPAFVSRVSCLVALLFFFKKPPEIFVTLHNIFFWLKPIHHYMNRLLGMMTRNIICVSAAVMNYSRKHDKINFNKYKIIYNGVDIKKYTPNPPLKKLYSRQIGLDENNFILGNIGVLSVRKGQKYLVEAFAKLQSNDRLRLVIYGSERPHEIDVAEELYSLINNKLLTDKVLILSPREDINQIYNMFDIFVMPSIVEGLSLCAIEAMLMEKICLFSDIEPFTEMVENGINGFIFKSEDSESLSSKLNYIIENYDDLRSIGKKAREIALKKYDVARMVKEYQKLYECIV